MPSIGKFFRYASMFFGLVLMGFTFYVISLSDAGDIERYQLQGRISEIYLILLIPFVIFGLVGFYFHVKR